VGCVFFEHGLHLLDTGVHQAHRADNDSRHGFIAVGNRTDDRRIFGVLPDVAFVDGKSC
jgi:hypothetical protein